MAQQMPDNPNDLPQGSVYAPGGDIFERSVGIIVAPVQTLRGIVRDRPVGMAVVVALVAGAVSGGSSCGPGSLDFKTGEFDAASLPDLGPGLIIAGVIAGLVFALPSLFLVSLVYHLVARVLGHDGSYPGILSGAAFAGIPSVLSAPLAVAGALGGGVAGTILSGLGGIVLVVWAIVLHIFAIRENYRMTTGIALAVWLLSLVAFVVLAFLFVIAIFVAVMLIGLVIGLAVVGSGG